MDPAERMISELPMIIANGSRASDSASSPLPENTSADPTDGPSGSLNGWICVSRAQGARIRFGALVALAVSFVRGSVAGGFDVARRALRPELDLRPGFVTAPLRLPPGNARNAFSALASLLPGTLPVGMDEDSLLVHGLDVAQPIAENLSHEESLFMRALGNE